MRYYGFFVSPRTLVGVENCLISWGSDTSTEGFENYIMVLFLRVKYSVGTHKAKYWFRTFLLLISVLNLSFFSSAFSFFFSPGTKFRL